MRRVLRIGNAETRWLWAYIDMLAKPKQSGGEITPARLELWKKAFLSAVDCIAMSHFVEIDDDLPAGCIELDDPRWGEMAA